MERSPLREYFRQIRRSCWRDGQPRSEQEMVIAHLQDVIAGLDERLTRLENLMKQRR